MARASVWGLGNPWAYQELDVDRQAELLALFHGEQETHADEVYGAVVERINDLLKHREKPGAPPSPPPVTGAASTPLVKVTPMFGDNGPRRAPPKPLTELL